MNLIFKVGAFFTVYRLNSYYLDELHMLF